MNLNRNKTANKVQKTQIVPKKIPKRNIKFQNVPKNATQKVQNRNISHFLDKTA